MRKDLIRVCPPPPPPFWGEGHTRWRERDWESPNSDEGTYPVVLFVIESIALGWASLATPTTP